MSITNRIFTPLSEARGQAVTFPGASSDGPGAFSVMVGTGHSHVSDLLSTHEAGLLADLLRRIRIRSLRIANMHDEAEQAAVDADADSTPMRARVVALVDSAWDDAVASGGLPMTKARLRAALVARLG